MERESTAVFLLNKEKSEASFLSGETVFYREESPRERERGTETAAFMRKRGFFRVFFSKCLAVPRKF